MKTLSAFALAMVLATGGALAQGTGGAGSGGGTPGTSTGKGAAAKPTAQDCARGYQAGSRWTQAEFNEACKKQ